MENTHESIDLINQNVETIAQLYARSERRASLHQKAIERVATLNEALNEAVEGAMEEERS